MTGPYLHRIFVGELGLPESCLMDAVPSEDFNGASMALPGFGTLDPIQGVWMFASV